MLILICSPGRARRHARDVSSNSIFTNRIQILKRIPRLGAGDERRAAATLADHDGARGRCDAQFAPFFANVKVFETMHPTRHNLYFYCADGALPFDANWPGAPAHRTNV
jgi:hypothetical protein